MVSLLSIGDFHSVLEYSPEVKKLKSSVSTDTRTLNAGDIFVALNGPHFNGSQFALEALKKEASVIVLNQSPENKEICKLNKCEWILVSDTLEFLKELSHSHLLNWKKQNRKLIGIAGSNGKTTTKEILAHLLSSIHPGAVHKTQANHNNVIGVCQTLLKLNDQHQFAILELGTNHPGELKELCTLSQPDMGILTNIGHEHLEFFKDLDGVFEEEKELFDYLKKQKQGALIIDGDDFYLSKLKNNSFVISYGEDGNDWKISYHKNSCVLEKGGEKYELNSPSLWGRHNFANLAACFLLAKSMCSENGEALINSARSFKPLHNRSSLIEWQGKQVYLDAYNANPSSMFAAFEAFDEFLKTNKMSKEQVVYILGDMFELGPQSSRLHQEISEKIDSLGVKRAIFIGQFSKDYQKKFKGEFLDFLNVDMAKENKQTCDWLRQARAIFIKGSRGVALERLLD